MSNLDRRTSRSVREKRAYRLVQVVSGVAGVATLLLSIIGVLSLGLPILLLIIAALCAYGFVRTTGKR
jgi:fatty acid desaturase